MNIKLTEEQILMIRGNVQEANADYKNNPIIDSPAKVYEQVKYIKSYKQEHFILLTLDGINRLIEKRTITKGTLTSSLVHPREVFRPAIEDSAASIIVVHNHPSGSSESSQADRDVTDRLSAVGDLVGIKLLDHVLVAGDTYSSIMND